MGAPALPLRWTTNTPHPRFFACRRLLNRPSNNASFLSKRQCVAWQRSHAFRNPHRIFVPLTLVSSSRRLARHFYDTFETALIIWISLVAQRFPGRLRRIRLTNADRSGMKKSACRGFTGEGQRSACRTEARWKSLRLLIDVY